MVHRQRAVLLHFLFVIYLAALLKMQLSLAPAYKSAVQAPSHKMKKRGGGQFLKYLFTIYCFGLCPTHIRAVVLAVVIFVFFCAV